MRFFTVLFLALAFAACSLVPKSGPSAEFLRRQKDLEAELKVSLSEMQNQNWPEAEKKLKAYIDSHPISTLSAQAKLNLGRSIEEQHRYPEALKIYREVAMEARRTAPDLAGMASLRMSACYEALGDEPHVMSALTDASSLASSLPVEMRELEIPARRAASWLRRKQYDEAKKELNRVDRALPGLFPPEDQSKRAEEARILYSISQLSLNSLQPENFLSLLDTQERLQNYLWRAMELKVEPWSGLAEKKLSENYETFVAAAANYKDHSQRKQLETRRQWMAAIVKSLEALKAYSGGDSQNVSPNFTKLVVQIEKQASGDLWSLQDSNPLTPEAKSRDQLKRQGRVISKPFFPKEKKADPNLNKDNE